MSEKVWVELNSVSRMPMRIFRSQKAAMHLVSNGTADYAAEMDRTLAVRLIRHQLFVRSGGNCELCGVIVLESSGHMHEEQHRGKGGEISLANSVFVCAKCHKHTHSDREPKFTRRNQ